MKRRLFVAGNWKMNKTAAEAAALARELRERIGDVADVDVAVCPPFTSLRAAVEVLEGSRIAVGAQNVHWAESGAFTGEISAAMLLEIPVTYVIIGHSERRQYFGETDATVNMRLKAALEAGLTPIVCLGETLDQREAGVTRAVVCEQFEHGFEGLDADSVLRAVIAYEPVWAIGTGRTATPEQAQEVHALLRSLLQEEFSKEAAERVRILYGGSVKPGNAADLFRQPDIDGGLVGGAGLKADDFTAIVRAAQSLS